MWSKHQTAEHRHGIRVCGPNNGYEVFCRLSNGNPTLSTCAELDAKYGVGMNAWLTDAQRRAFDVVDGLWCWQYAAGPTLNTTLLKRLLTARTEWSRK